LRIDRFISVGHLHTVAIVSGTLRERQYLKYIRSLSYDPH
jgi:hypothetical protein